jgi:hypothetical protein
MTEHLLDEAMAGHLARAGGIGLARYIAGDEVTDHSRFTPDETLKFQGRMSVDSLEHRLRFSPKLPSNDDQNGSIPASVLPQDTIEENDLR